MIKHLNRISMAAAIAALALPPLAAHAQTYTQLNSGVTGLRYTLVDLAPNDGITPAIFWGNGSIGASATHAEAIPNLGLSPATYQLYDFDTLQEIPDGSRPNDYLDVAKTTDATLQGPSTLALLGADTITVSTNSGNGQLQFSSTGITSSASVTADQVRTQQANFEVPASPAGSSPAFALSRTVSFASTAIDGQASSDMAGASFTLTPNTALRIEGTIYVDGQFDASTLVSKVDAVRATPGDNNEYYAYIGGAMGSSISVSGGTPIDEPFKDAISQFFDAGYTYESSDSSQAVLSASLVGYGFSGIGYLPDAPATLNERREFSLTFANATAEDRQGALSVASSAESSYKFLGRLIDIHTAPVGDVPEPSTLLLMALGLGAMAAQRGRRSKLL